MTNSRSLYQRAFGAGFATFLFLGLTAFQDGPPPILYQPDPDSPIGEMNPNAPAGVAEFAFVIGDWDADITWTPPNGEPLNYTARWHNRWVNDGFDIIQEWRGPFLTGMEIRHYDPEAGWSGMNLYVGRAGFVPTTAERQGDTMVVYIHKASGPNGPFINRETYFNITENSWDMKSDLSFDGGETWQQGRYHMTATRVE